MQGASNRYRGAIIAARLKRFATIEGKPRRPNTSFQLNAMHDIARCRCVLPTVNTLRNIQSRIEPEESVRESHDYLSYSKTFSYRSAHFVANITLPHGPYGKLPLEIQLRTQLQHLWSTAVEAFDICQKRGIKFDQSQSSLAARTFALISNLFARREGLPFPPSTPQDERNAIEGLKAIGKNIRLFEQLRAYSDSVSIVTKETSGADNVSIVYHLLSMMYTNAFGIAGGFSSIEATLRRRTELEQRNQIGDDAALVLTSSEQDIGYALSNYTSNISEFLELLSTYFHG